MVFLFAELRSQRLVEQSSDAAMVVTNDVVQALLVSQRSNEQIVEDMADVASIHNVRPIVIKKLLNVSRENEIVSGGVWFEPFVEDTYKDQFDYFYHRDENGTFVSVESYDDQMEGSYRGMEFYVLAKELKPGETFWTKAYVDPVTKVRMITVVSPIIRKEKFVGVASLDMKLSLKQKEMFSELIGSNEHYFLLTDRIGKLLVCSQEFRNIGLNSENKDQKTMQNAYPYMDYLFKDYKKSRQTQKSDSTLAQRLASSSTDIDKDESNLLVYELGYRQGMFNKERDFNAMIVEDDPIFKESTVVATYYFPRTGWHMLIGIPEHVVLKGTFDVYEKIIGITVVVTLFAALFGYLLIRMLIVKPIESISQQIATKKLSDYSKIEIDDVSEIGMLADSFNTGIEELREAKEKERRNETLLMQQSKMAAMGEMLDAVAHQWKQPLNALSMYAELIKMNYEDGEVDQAYIEQFQKDIETQINHMTDTLGTFRTFFRPSTALSQFNLRNVINDVLLLAKDELTKNTIEVEVVEQDALELYGSENEFKHLLLNILNNAKDAFIDNKIKKRVISIKTVGSDTPRLEVQDSAGGIPQPVIEHIFQAHFTTKEEGKGTGIGLYMSSQIAQKHHATLRVENRENGACFVVDFSELSFHA